MRGAGCHIFKQFERADLALLRKRLDHRLNKRWVHFVSPKAALVCAFKNKCNLPTPSVLINARVPIKDSARRYMLTYATAIWAHPAINHELKGKELSQSSVGIITHLDYSLFFVNNCIFDNIWKLLLHSTINQFLLFDLIN